MEAFQTELNFKRPLTIEEQFEIYNQANPHIWYAFMEEAFEQLRQGRKHLSAKAIIEKLRYETNLRAKDFQKFKINNSFTSLYARKLIEEFPEFASFFELRERKEE